MIQIKISGETPKSGPTICRTCKSSATITGQNCEERVLCNAGMFESTRNVVSFKVATCARYHPLLHPWLHEMEDMAWKIEARKRGTVGFYDPNAPPEMEVVITRPGEDSGGGVPG